MGSSVSTPAALLFTEQELGGPCLEQESYPTATTTGVVAAQGNGERVGLTIMNLSANSVYIGLAGVVTSSTGIFLPGNGGFLTVNVRDDFTLPSRQWTALSVGGTAQLYVLEIIRYRSQEVS